LFIFSLRNLLLLFSDDVFCHYSLQSQHPGFQDLESPGHFFGTGVPGLKLSSHQDFGTNIFFISYTKCIANLVSSPYFFCYSTNAQLAEFVKENQLMIDVKIITMTQSSFQAGTFR
jgi:hypothetical protein